MYFGRNMYMCTLSVGRWSCDCKVALTTLRTEMTWIQDGGYTAVDPTSPGLSTPYRSFTAWCIPGAVYRGYARAGRLVGLPESAVTSSEVQNSVYKGSGGCFARFLCCVRVYYNLGHLDVLYRGIHAYCKLQLNLNHVVSRCSEYHHPCISFIFFLLLLK